jgi:hypothetical protein
MYFDIGLDKNRYYSFVVGHVDAGWKVVKIWHLWIVVIFWGNLQVQFG